MQMGHGAIRRHLAGWMKAGRRGEGAAGGDLSEQKFAPVDVQRADSGGR